MTLWLKTLLVKLKAGYHFILIKLFHFSNLLFYRNSDICIVFVITVKIPSECPCIFGVSKWILEDSIGVSSEHSNWIFEDSFRNFKVQTETSEKSSKHLKDFLEKFRKFPGGFPLKLGRFHSKLQMSVNETGTLAGKPWLYINISYDDQFYHKT